MKNMNYVATCGNLGLNNLTITTYKLWAVARVESSSTGQHSTASDLRPSFFLSAVLSSIHCTVSTSCNKGSTGVKTIYRHYFTKRRITNLLVEMRCVQTFIQFLQGEACPLWEKDLPGWHLEDLPWERLSHKNWTPVSDPESLLERMGFAPLLQSPGASAMCLYITS